MKKFIMEQVFLDIFPEAQIGVLIASVFPTEAALKKEFDENGNRRGK